MKGDLSDYNCGKKYLKWINKSNGQKSKSCYCFEGFKSNISRNERMSLALIFEDISDNTLQVK